MQFPEPIRLRILKRADFCCAWCGARRSRINVHHIDPQRGDLEDNGAPLCGSCHETIGGNPELRKQLREKRDHLYELCEKAYSSAFGFDVPELACVHDIPESETWRRGILLTDRQLGDLIAPPTLYLSFHVGYWKLYHGQPEDTKRWLNIEVDMRVALNVRMRICASSEYDVSRLMGFLRGTREGVMLTGEIRRIDERCWADYLMMWIWRDEKRLMVSTWTVTGAEISIRARMSGEVALALADYLDDMGFAAPFEEDGGAGTIV